MYHHVCYLCNFFFQAEDDQEQPGDTLSTAQAQQGQPPFYFFFRMKTIKGSQVILSLLLKLSKASQVILYLMCRC